MQRDLCERRIGWFCLVAIILFFGALAQQKHAAAADDDHPAAQPVPIPNTEDFKDPQRLRERFRDQLHDDGRLPWDQAPHNLQESLAFDYAAGAGKYWLGVECREAQPELRSQLGLKDDEGLVVLHVAEDGPATKAGIKQHDVIIAAGDTTLTRPSDLIKAVNAADGKEISLKIIRSGKQQTIAVTPAERPQENSRLMLYRMGPNALFMGPGGGPHVDLPDNVTITIVHHAKDPGKITVTRGDEKWEITDRELNKLPDDLRPLVERTIGVGPGAFPVGFNFPGMRVEGMTMGPPDRNGPPPRDGQGPPHDGDGPRMRDRNGPPHDGGGPPPRDGQQDGRNPASRDADNGPPPRGPESGSPPPRPRGPEAQGDFRPSNGPGAFGPGQGGMIPPDQILPQLMQRLDRIDHRLETMQDDIHRMQQRGLGPGMRGRGPGGNVDGPPPRNDQ